MFGDFEDWDTDADRFEPSRWDPGSSSLICLEAARKGAVGLRSKRSPTVLEDSVIPFRERIRVEGDYDNQPNKDLTLLGYVRGDHAGSIEIVCRYYVSKGTLEFGEEVAFSHAEGSYGWEPFSASLNMPADTVIDDPNFDTTQPHALRLFLHHSPPRDDFGTADFDDLAIVSWQKNISGLGDITIKAPNALDFLRVQASKGNYTLKATFRSFQPSMVP
jgi:hypothetical protein